MHVYMSRSIYIPLYLLYSPLKEHYKLEYEGLHLLCLECVRYEHDTTTYVEKV